LGGRPITESYAAAGVNIDVAAKAKELIGKHARSTLRPEVLSGVGFFGGLFEFKGFKQPVLVSSVDGVGTKLKIASACAKHDTIGVDLVHHCVNDILTCGAEPLFFLDYIAMGKLVPQQVEAMAKGKQAAESVDRFLKGEHLRYGREYAGPYETDFFIDTGRGAPDGRAKIPQYMFTGKGDFQEIEKGFDTQTARKEAKRCYSCGEPFGKYRTCWFCLPCEVECPHDALWVEIPYLLR